MMNRMTARIARNQQDTVEVIETDRIRLLAKSTIDQYTNLPTTPINDKSSNATFSFWRNYSRSSDIGQKGLAHLARFFLTPPPTSTGDFAKYFEIKYTVRVDSLPHRKCKEIKQQPSMLPGPAVPGSCLVSFCFR